MKQFSMEIDQNSSQILMNPDKLTLNGREVKVKEIEVGGETLSVLQVI